MPVRSLHSSVLRWPSRDFVVAALKDWLRHEAVRQPHLVRLGYFGSCATGRWGVGSDLDLVAVVRSSGQPFERRAVSWDLAALPVAAELLVYTSAEWEELQASGERFARMLREDTVWVWDVAGL